MRTISTRYNVPIGSLKRHKESGHVAKKIKATAAAKEEREAKTFIQKVGELETKAESLYHMAAGEGDVRGACSALRELRGAVELGGKATGELTEKHEITGKDGTPLTVKILKGVSMDDL